MRGLKTYAMGAKNIAAAVWVRGGSGKTVIYPPLGWEWPLKRSFPEAHRGGMEGAALKISETTGSIIMGATKQTGEVDGTKVAAAKKSKKERRDKRDKRRGKDSRQDSEQAPRPSKAKAKGSSSKRRPKVGA